MKVFATTLLALGAQGQYLPAPVATTTVTKVIPQPYPVVAPLPYVSSRTVFPYVVAQPIVRPLPAAPLYAPYPIISTVPLYAPAPVVSLPAPITTTYVQPAVTVPAATPWVTQNFNPTLFTASATALPLPATMLPAVKPAGTIPPITLAEWEAMQAGRVPWPSSSGSTTTLPATTFSNPASTLPYATLPAASVPAASWSWPATTLPAAPLASWSSSSALPLASASWQFPASSGPAFPAATLAPTPFSSWPAAPAQGSAPTWPAAPAQGSAPTWPAAPAQGSAPTWPAAPAQAAPQGTFPTQGISFPAANDDYEYVDY